MPSHQKPRGEYALGSIRARLPPGPGEKAGLFAQITYPADVKAGKLDVEKFNWFRDEALEGLGSKDNGAIPLWGLRAAAANVSQCDPSYIPLKHPKGEKWPIVIYCHGLYGAAEMYTQLCRELASNGTIVVAVDHEDGTALHANKGDTGERLYFIDEPGGGVLGGDDLAAFSKREVEFRHPFLEERTREVANTCRGLQYLARGEVKASEEKEQKALHAVMANADPERFVYAAHSFGSTACVFFFHSQEAKSLPFKGAIIADVWWQPDVGEMTQEFPVPFIQLLSEDWCFTKDVRKGAAGALALHEASPINSVGLVWFKGTKHLWISELSYFAPAWLLRKAGQIGTSDLQEVHEATTRCYQACVEALLPGRDAEGTPKERFEEVMYSHYMDKASCCTSGVPLKEIALPYNRVRGSAGSPILFSSSTERSMRQEQ